MGCSSPCENNANGFAQNEKKQAHSLPLGQVTANSKASGVAADVSDSGNQIMEQKDPEVHRAATQSEKDGNESGEHFNL